MNLIFCLDTKHFLLPALTLRQFLRARGEPADVLMPPGLAAVAGVLSPELSHSVASDPASLPDDAHLHFFHHDSPAIYELFRRTMAWLVAPGRSFRGSVSFYPDGFGNATRGVHFARQFALDTGIDLRVREFFSFGFEHASTRRLIRPQVATVVGYEHLRGLLAGSPGIRDIVGTVAAALPPNQACVMLPYRPWCTRTFHDGVYDFGSQEALHGIYSGLIRRAMEAAGGPAYVLFRRDDRYAAESAWMSEALAASFPLVDLHGLYPYWLTLEPLIHGLFASGALRSAAMVCLDSTSFQAPVFLLDEMAPIDFTAYLGAPYRVVAAVPGGEAFIERRLRNKVVDFERRYTSFRKLGKLTEVAPLEDGLLLATMRRSARQAAVPA